MKKSKTKPKSLPLYQKGINIISTVGLAIILCSISLFILKYLGPLYYEKWDNSDQLFRRQQPDIKYILSACIVAPLIEELLWRYLPIEIGRKMFPNFKQFQYQYVALLGILFGYWHDGVPTIFIQGIGGVLFGLLYIKNGYSYLSSVLAHSLYNFSCCVLLILFL